MRSNVHTRSAHVKMDSSTSVSSSTGGAHAPSSWQGNKGFDGVDSSPAQQHHEDVEGQPLLLDPLVSAVAADPRGEQVNAEALYSKVGSRGRYMLEAGRCSAWGGLQTAKPVN